jgi:hypothetical protein
MSRKSLNIIASGLVIAIIALSAAWLASGRDFRDKVTASNVEWTGGDGAHHRDGPRITRSFALQSGAKLVMAVPVDLEFQRGDHAGMTVEGPKEMIDRLVWDGGRLSLRNQGYHHGSLKVTIAAPEIGALAFDAPADVDLRGLDQEELRLTGRGAIELEAQGRVRRLFVDSAGAGSIDLSHVQGDDATVRIDGVGDVEVAATNLVDVEINGAGNVSLKERPRTARTRINSVGSVDRDYED